MDEAESHPDPQHFLHQLGADDEARACNLLSDKYWRKHFRIANAAVCDYLAAMWAEREREMAAEMRRQLEAA
jgi:hypothetical protein